MDALKFGELFAKLKPRIIDLISIVGGGVGPFAPSPHDLNSAHHTGTIADAQATQFLKTDGTRQLTGNLTVANGITIDGVDISAHAGSVSAHHEPVTIADSSTIDLSLSGQQLSAAVIQSGLDHGSIGGLGDDDHSQYYNVARHTLALHTGLGLVPDSRQVISGNGLGGGGSLTADRTLAVGAGTGISVGADSVGIDLAANLTWTGNHVFQGGLSTRHLLPELTDTYDLGSSLKLWRKGWLSELESVLFVENSTALLGGWLIVGKGEGTLPSDVEAADEEIDFGQSMTEGQFVVLRTSLQVEYVQVGAIVSGTTYEVIRDLDESGANDWVAGTVYLILGVGGDGRIELNAVDTPRISVLQQGPDYNLQTEQIRIGDLNGNWGYNSEKLGIAIGEYASNKANLTLDPTNGLRLRIYETDYIVLDNSGNAKLSGKLQLDGTNSALAIGNTPPSAADTGTGLWLDRTGLFAVKNDAPVVTLDEDGVSILPGTATNVEFDRSLKFISSLVGGYSSLIYGWESDAGATDYGHLRLEAGVEDQLRGRIVLLSHARSAHPSEFISLELDGVDGLYLRAANTLKYAGVNIEGSINLFDGSGYGYAGKLTHSWKGIDGVHGLAPDGWYQGFSTPVYHSSTQIKFSNYSGNFRDLFPIGTKIKFTQSSVKYFYVIGASYSDGITYLTINGGSDYSVSNATISEFCYSHGLAFGFPAFFNYNGNITQITGTPPNLGNATRKTIFSIEGNKVFLSFSITMGSTTTYGDGNNWYLTYPFSATISFANSIVYIFDSGARFYYANAITQGAGILMPYEAVSGLYVKNNQPMTWATNDRLWVSIEYHFE